MIIIVIIKKDVSESNKMGLFYLRFTITYVKHGYSKSMFSIHLWVSAFTLNALLEKKEADQHLTICYQFVSVTKAQT